MEMRIGFGLGTEKEPLQAARQAVSQAKSQIATEKIDLAIAFGSVDFSHPAVLKTISGLLGAVPLVGSSSLAIITRQGIFKHGLALLLLSTPESIYFNTAYVNGISAKAVFDAGEELGDKLLYGFKNIRRDFALLFSDGLLRDGSGFLYGLQEKLGRSFPIIGASASDNLRFKKTYQYFDEEALSDASCGVLWGGKLSFGLGIKHGWKPLGKPRQITKAIGNVVYEIDGRPATEIYKEYFGFDLIKLKRELRLISVLYPIGIRLAGEEEYLLRNIHSIENNGAIIFQGSVPELSTIRLMIGTKESCLLATSQALDEAKRGIAGRPCNFVLVFDSVSRYILLGRQAHRELEIIKEGLDKNTPIMGIYTYGEQAPLRALGYQGKSYFHNQTIAIMAVGG